MKDDINRLLEEFGNYLGLESLALDEDNYCCLSFDAVFVNIEAIPASSMVLLHTTLGQVAENAGADIYRQLLEANYFFQQTAGATLGLETGTRVVALTQIVDIAHMDLSGWEAVIQAFVDAAETCTPLCGEAVAAVPATAFASGLLPASLA